MNADTYDYRTKNVEIFIDGNDYVEYDVMTEREILRRKATKKEIKSFGDND